MGVIFLLFNYWQKVLLSVYILQADLVDRFATAAVRTTNMSLIKEGG